QFQGTRPNVTLNGSRWWTRRLHVNFAPRERTSHGNAWSSSIVSPARYTSGFRKYDRETKDTSTKVREGSSYSGAERWPGWFPLFLTRSSTICLHPRFGP